MLAGMTVLDFYQVIGAVVFGNALSAVFAYGLWRATKIEKKLGVKDGSQFLPFWLIIAMMGAPGAGILAAATLN